MLELAIEILVYLAIAMLIGFLLGYLAWGWGLQRKLQAARTEGIASVRTSMHGDSAHESQLAECQKQRKRLELALERSKVQIKELQDRLDKAGSTSDERSETGSSEEEAAEGTTTEDAANAVEDAEIDLSETPEQEMPAAGGRRLFATDDVDPRISGIESKEASEQAAEPDPIPMATPEVSSPEPAQAPASLLSERPEKVDNLKEIKGVGVVMEGVLNDKGVYLFHQIANFSDADIAWVNEAIEAFPGRIVRDNWVGQAKGLYRSKYGKSHDE